MSGLIDAGNCVYQFFFTNNEAMKKFEINGKEYPMEVNALSLSIAERINQGVSKELTIRYDFGFALACFLGADKECDLTMDALFDRFGKTKAAYNELIEAVKDELNRYNGVTDEEEEPEQSEEPDDEKKR